MEILSGWLVELLKTFYNHLVAWVIIDQYEMGVKLRWGKNPKILCPGVHFKLPFADYVVVCVVVDDTKSFSPVYITTLDGKTAVATPVVRYTITDPIKWLIDTNDAGSNLDDITCIVTADFLSDMNWEDCKKKSTLTKIKNKLNTKVESMGVVVSEYGLRNLALSRLIITKL